MTLAQSNKTVGVTVGEGRGTAVGGGKGRAVGEGRGASVGGEDVGTGVALVTVMMSRAAGSTVGGGAACQREDGDQENGRPTSNHAFHSHSFAIR